MRDLADILLEAYKHRAAELLQEIHSDQERRDKRSEENVAKLEVLRARSKAAEAACIAAEQATIAAVFTQTAPP